MLLILPPSETKRPGGEGGSCLELDRLSFGTLTGVRSRLLDDVVELASDRERAIAALGLGPRQRGALDVDRALATSPVRAAMDRYSGVVYDALDAATLPCAARESAARHVAVFSALFGPVLAGDRIPEYRLSAGSRVPGERLASRWAEPVAGAIAAHGEQLIVDARSEAYRALAPLAEVPGVVRLVVVEETSAGVRRVLAHAGKAAKGRFVRSLAEASARGTGCDAFGARDADELVALSAAAGQRLVPLPPHAGSDTTLGLVVAAAP